MRFTFMVEVEVERSQGKFATREELADQIQQALENAQESELEGENGGQYDVTDWTVSEAPEEKKPKAKKLTPPAAPPLPEAQPAPLPEVQS